jgi:hypothetical protein
MVFNRESFEKGKGWFYESQICLYRSFIIIHENPNDIHGAIEALQHCFELSCKSLYIMLDLPYPRYHDAAKDLDEVGKKLFQAIPDAKQENWPSIKSWIKKNSKYLGEIHETSMYGDEKKGILASKLFSKEDIGDLMIEVSAFWSFAYHTLAQLGVKYNALTQEEYADYTLYCEFSKDVNKLDTFQKYRYFKKIFARARACTQRIGSPSGCESRMRPKYISHASLVLSLY